MILQHNLLTSVSSSFAFSSTLLSIFGLRFVLGSGRDDQLTIGTDPPVEGRQEPSIDAVDREHERDDESDAIEDEDDENLDRTMSEKIDATTEDQNRGDGNHGKEVKPEEKLEEEGYLREPMSLAVYILRLHDG